MPTPACHPHPFTPRTTRSGALRGTRVLAGLLAGILRHMPALLDLAGLILLLVVLRRGWR